MRWNRMPRYHTQVDCSNSSQPFWFIKIMSVWLFLSIPPWIGDLLLGSNCAFFCQVGGLDWTPCSRTDLKDLFTEVNWMFSRWVCLHNSLSSFIIAVILQNRRLGASIKGDLHLKLHCKKIGFQTCPCHFSKTLNLLLFYIPRFPSTFHPR